MGKLAALHALGQQRRRHTYAGYQNLGQFHQGGYETDFVSPYTNGAANVDAALVLVLQDWASADALQGPFHPEWAVLGHDPERITNKRFKMLLRDAFGLEFADVFVTNLFPFIKPGAMSNSIRQGDLDRALKEFCWPQIEIVQPKAVVCLGAAVYNTFARNLTADIPQRVGDSGAGLRNERRVGDSFRKTGRVIWYQSHPAARVSATKMIQGWHAMKTALKQEFGRRFWRQGGPGE